MNLEVCSVGIGIVVVCLCVVVVGSIVLMNVVVVVVVVLPPWSHLLGWSRVNKRLVALI